MVTTLLLEGVQPSGGWYVGAIPVHYSRDSSTLTTVKELRSSASSPAEIQNPPHCLLPWGSLGQEGGGRTSEAVAQLPPAPFTPLRLKVRGP